MAATQEFINQAELASIFMAGEPDLGADRPDLPKLPKGIETGANLAAIGRLVLPSIYVEGREFNFKAVAEVRNGKYVKEAQHVIRGGHRFEDILEPAEAEGLIGPEGTLLWHPWQAVVRAQKLQKRASDALSQDDLGDHVKRHVDLLTYSEAIEEDILCFHHDDGEYVEGDTGLRNKTPESEQRVFEAGKTLVKLIVGPRGEILRILSDEMIERSLKHDIDSDTAPGRVFKHVNERWGYLVDGAHSLRSSRSRTIMPNNSLLQSSLVEFGLESVSREVIHFSNLELLLEYPMIFDIMHASADEIEAGLTTYKEADIADAIEESLRAVEARGKLPDGTTIESEMNRISLLHKQAARTLFQDPPYRTYPAWEEFAEAVA